MKNELVLAGVSLTIGLLLLFVGCTSSSNENGQGAGTQENAQQQAASDNGQGAGAPVDTQQQTTTDNQQPTAQNPGTQPQGGDQRGQRQGRNMGAQFIQACNGKAAGDTCTLNMRNQSIDGTCTDQNGNLTCMPNNSSLVQRPGGFPGGGVAFIQACSGKTAGDACTLMMRNQSIDGTCTSRNGNLTCTPANRNNGLIRG